MCEWRIEGRHGTSDPAASRDWSLASAYDAHIYGGKVMRTETDTVHVQPLVARLALDHRPTVIRRVAYTTSAFIRKAAAVCRGSGETSVCICSWRDTKRRIVRIVKAVRTVV
jgi:hypothetical protein